MNLSIRTHRLSFTFSVLYLLFVHRAAALPIQESQITPVEETADEAGEPVRIPASDIPSRADEVLANLRRVEALMAPSDEVEAIRSTLDEQTGVLVALHSELDEIDTDRVSTRVLEDHRLKWVKFQALIGGWMAGLQDRWKTLQDERERLLETRRQWEATRVIAASEEFSPELIQRIDTISRRLSEIDSRIRERSDAVAAVIDRVSGGGEVIAESLGKVDAMSAEVRGRWLHRDEPPLWNVAPIAERSNLWRQAREARNYWLGTIMEFVVERQERFYMLLALFVAFLLVALLLRHRSRSWPVGDRELDTARFLASRPASTALAFSLVLMAYVVGTPPVSVRDAIGLLAIVPVVRLGAGLVAPAARRALYGAVTLYLLDRLWEIAPDASLLRRLLLFAFTALALVGTIRLIQRWRADGHSKTNGWWRLATAGLYIAAAFLGLSLLVGALGWSTLAQLLTASTIESAFGAVAFLVVAKTAMGLIPLLPRSFVGHIFRSLPKHKQQLYRIVGFIVIVYVVIRWGRNTLQQFQVYEPVRQWIAANLSAPLARGTLEISLGKVSAALVILISTYLTARFIRFVLREEVLPRFPLSEGVAHSIVTLINYAVISFGIILAAATLGFSGTQLTVVFGALGVGIGFGLQTVVANFVSGLILIFERPVKVGDRVQTVDHFGIITDIGIRASTIRTFDGAEVVVPNSDLVSKEVINWTRSDQSRRVEVLVKVAYGTDPKKVLEMLRALAEAHPAVLANPEPSAWMIGFGESSLDFRLFAWARVQDFLVVSSELHIAVNEALQQAGIEIPVPRRDLEVRSKDERSMLVGDDGEVKEKFNTELQ